MDFRFTAAQEKFRREIREFLRQEMTPELRKAIEALRRPRGHHRETHGRERGPGIRHRAASRCLLTRPCSWMAKPANASVRRL